MVKRSRSKVNVKRSMSISLSKVKVKGQRSWSKGQGHEVKVKRPRSRSRSKVKVKRSRSRGQGQGHDHKTSPENDSVHAKCGGVQLHNVRSSTPTLVFSAKPQAGVQAKNRRTFKVIPAEIAEFKIDSIPMGCPPPRSSFSGIFDFCPTVHANLCTYLLLYLVPLPQISAIRRPIVTKLRGHDKGLIIC